MRRVDEPVFGTLLIVCVAAIFGSIAWGNFKDGLPTPAAIFLAIGNVAIAIYIARSIYFDRIKK